MSLDRLLLCTDMDRTVIPNGSQPEHPAARERFRAFCRQPEVCLAYVTGRHLQLVKQAIVDYSLPEPDFAITDVGSRIYQVSHGNWQAMLLWEEQIAADWCGKSHAQLELALRPIHELTLQEVEKQNRFKLSYYLALEVDKDRVMECMRDSLSQLGVAASLIWSVDEPRQIGLLDVLPENATKLHGLMFLQQLLGYAHDEIVFAGDSGNDLPVLGSAIRSVLVANASEEVKLHARQLAIEAGHADSLYLAKNEVSPLGGNYAAGVLQGIYYFHPELRRHLQGLDL
jgi:HAD superfamily hydrolase (TIGR01484 family)